MTLYILKYNNYYNRLVKKEESFSDYQPYILYTVENINFNPNDDVNTTHVIGVGDYDGKGDYVIITNTRRRPVGAPAGWEEYVVSRWFIVEANRTRAGQWNLMLHRDVIADYKEIIQSSPMFIEKATLSSSADPFIFNSENMTYNQILQSQTLLQDETKTPWIVGYVPRNSFTQDTKVEVEQYVDDAAADYKVNGLSNWKYW